MKSNSNILNDVKDQSANASTDYRDELKAILENMHMNHGVTRYKIAKTMGIDSGTLSNVLAKRRHFSIEKLEQILSLCGYTLTLQPKGAPDQRLTTTTQPADSTKAVATA